MKAEELANALDMQAEHHFQVAQECDMRPCDTLNWEHFETNKKAATELRRLTAEIQSLTEERTAWRTTAENAEAELKAIKEAEPVAWEVYVAEADHGYLVDSLDDPQLIDDCTNHDAVVTPLYTLQGESK